MHEPVQKPVLNFWPDRFNQIERKRVTIRRIGVQKAHSRIESASTRCQSTFALGNSIYVIEQGVSWVDRQARTAGEGRMPGSKK